jgi:hypothetical protein
VIELEREQLQIKEGMKEICEDGRGWIARIGLANRQMLPTFFSVNASIAAHYEFNVGLAAQQCAFLPD